MAKKDSITVLIDEPTKRWLLGKVAKRVGSDQYKHGTRSINAVVGEIIEAAKQQDERRAA